jgi:hypothetical protein
MIQFRCANRSTHQLTQLAAPLSSVHADLSSLFVQPVDETLFDDRIDDAVIEELIQ